jgi:PKD repeat protein
MQNLTTSSVRPALSILGAETGPGGEAGLTYTWSVGLAPAGALPVTFSDNGTNSAKNASARFRSAGTYQLNCVITNAAGHSVTDAISIKVKQVATTLRLTPHGQQIARRTSLRFDGVLLDQFNQMMKSAATRYAVISGPGTIDQSGLFAAGNKTGHAVIQFTIDDLVGSVAATVV